MAFLVLRISLLVFLASFISCQEEEPVVTYPFILLETGNEFTQAGDRVPVGGQLKFGISAVGDGSAITNLRVKRITESDAITELDKGIYIATGGIDTVLSYTKSGAETETWNFFIMNENRDTASVFIDVMLGDGSAYGDILYFSSIILGYQANTEFPHYLDLDSGYAYSSANVGGFEPAVDLAAFFYYTSGKASPTLTCPAYPSAQAYYPDFAGWQVKNATQYDYYSTDNDLVSPEEFDSAENDSLLVAGYKPQNVSGLCKYCYTGKVIPFKTSGGKYGMVRVIRADEEEGGTMEIEVKIQQ
jgi:hypothetical protein